MVDGPDGTNEDGLEVDGLTEGTWDGSVEGETVDGELDGVVVDGFEVEGLIDGLLDGEYVRATDGLIDGVCDGL